MASEDFLIRLSMVFKKFRLIANEFLSVICQFLNVGIINLSLEFYISHFCNKAINGFCNSICFICHTFYLIITKLNITQSTLLDIPTFPAIYSNISHRYCIFAEIISLMEDKDFNRIKVVLVEHKRTARWLSEALGKIEYSKHKGLDDKKCEALLLDSLKDHGSLTKPEIVRLLWDVLPDQLDDKQKNNKLDYLLKRLRKAGKIWTERNEVTSVWHLTEK